MKEELNDIVCQSSSDYEILDNAYDYIEKLEKENKQLKDNWDKLKNFITKEYYMYLPFAASTKSITILIDKMKELEGSDSNE